MNILTAIGYIINILNEKTEEIAKDIGFKVRKGKLESLTFVLGLTYSLSEVNEITLKTILRRCKKIQIGLKISKQALHKRMEIESKLMEELYKQIFNESSKKLVKVDYFKELNTFSDTYLTDATTISLPDKLKNKYKGLGGRNADSAMKIQTTYSILQQKITNLDITDATQNDTTNNQKTVNNMKAGELYIKDLGYYETEYFSKINEKKGFYLSRIKINTKLYKYNKKTKKYYEIDYCKLYKSADECIDIEVFINNKDESMLKTRFVCIKLPEEIISKRLSKKNKGKTISKKEKLYVEMECFYNKY